MTRIVVDALQVGGEASGVGRIVTQLGSELHDLPAVELELRCTVQAAPLLAPAFPSTTLVRTPLPRNSSRLRRILYQQLVAPRGDSATLLVCPGDQGPLLGRARVLLVVNDVRRLARPDTCGRAEAAFYGFLVPRATRRATVVVTISEFSRQEIERLLGVRAVVVSLHPPPRPEPAPGGDHLLVVGALRRYKAPETVIEALALLEPAERRDVLLVGPEEGRRDELRQLAARRGVGGRVRVLGWVDEPTLEGLYAGAFATVCPSTYEGYGLPVAESLSRGLPTVVSDIPPHREIAAGAAAYFPAGDARSLAAVLHRVGSEPDFRAGLGRRGHERSKALAGEGRSWRAVVADVLDTIDGG